MYYSRFTKVPEIWNESNVDLENLKFMDERPYATNYLQKLHNHLEDREMELLGNIEKIKESIDNNSKTPTLSGRKLLKLTARKLNITIKMISIENELCRRIRYNKFINALNNDNEGA